jgi:hypothetical protein
MKKIISIVLALFFLAAGNVSAQTLSDATVVDETGTDFFYYWYVGTIGKQIAVDSDGEVHVTYLKTWIADADTGYQVKYANVTTGVNVDVPSQEPDDPIQPAVSFIGGGQDGTPVYVMYGVGGRAYNYGPAMHNMAMAKVNDAGDGLDPLGVQNDALYYADPHYSNPFAMVVDNANGVVHCAFTNPSGWEFGYWNFDGSNFGEVYNLQNVYPDSDVPGRSVPGQHRKNAAEGVDIAVSSDGSEVSLVSLHSYNQIWIHKGTFGGDLWESDFAAAMDAGEMVPLFDTTAAVEWLPDLYNANAARPYNDAQIAYDKDDNLVVVYTATYRSHWMDTVSTIDGWWRDHGSWPGDQDGHFFDGSTKAKPAVHAWTETTGTHNVVTESIYPMIGETFDWFAYAEFDSGFGFFGNAYADGIIGNLELAVNHDAGEGEPQFVLLIEQMGAPAENLVDTNWAFSHNYFAYKNDVFSMTSDNGSDWTNFVNLTETPDLDENDVSAVIADGNLHVMWTSDNFGGRDRGLVYADDYESKYLLYTDGGAHFSIPIRLNAEDQAKIMYKSVPLSILTDVEDAVIPGNFELSQNYPNPFNPTTSISYSIPARSDVSIKVYNNIGQLVTTLVNGINEAGNHKVNWNASSIASGVYFYTINAGDFTSTKKMILLR